MGPLPPRESTEILPLNFCYNSGRNHRLNPVPDQQELAKWAIGIAMEASDITLELLGSVRLNYHTFLKTFSNYYNQEVNPYDPNSLGATLRVSLYKNGTMTAWVEILGHSTNPDSNFLLSQGLYIKISKQFQFLDLRSVWN